MKQTVTGFDCGFSNSALRMPYALARLTCSHLARVECKPARYKCAECSAEKENCTACPCGYRGGFRVSFRPNPHLEADRVTKVGDVIDCERCDAEAKQLDWLRGLDRQTVQHARYREWCGQGQYNFYRRDTSSPSGVMLIGSVAATPAADAILAEKRIAPLSPTENLCAPSRGQW